jgi:hypothetical protein
MNEALNYRTHNVLLSTLLCFACSVGAVAQSSSNLCGLLAANQYTVNSGCVNQGFNVPTSYTASMNPGTCNSGNFRDGWGWFTATSTFTTIQYQGNQDAVLHVFTGNCAALQAIACSDAFTGAVVEATTIPTVVGQNYFVRVQRRGSSAGMTGNLCVFSSNPAGACGSTVYDSGGAGGNYSNNERRITTYCPPGPGEAVTLTFSQFNTEGGFDFFYVLSGSGTGGTLLGTFSGTTLPPSITSPDPSGCLTIVFFSDGSANRPGWSAQVSCNTAPNCFYVLTLNDSYGDGWGSSSVGVSINGGAVQNYTIGGSTGQILIPVNVGNTVVFSYNASGAFQEENSYNVTIAGQGGLFLSGSPPVAGITFTSTVDCIPSPAAQEDCVGGFTICSDQQFNNNTTSTGFIQDLNSSNRGCLEANEQQGTWYYFSPATSGTLAFTIAPSANIDYDFAIWGPMAAPTCPPSGAPIRCSWAIGDTYYNFFGNPTGGTFFSTGSYNTGLRPSAGQTTEGQAGDGWVEPLNVVAGQVYMLYIDNFDVTGQSFTLDWDLSNGASLDCTVLPVEFLSLNADPNSEGVKIEWTTGSEYNASHFVVERRSETEAFSAIGTVRAIGESTSPSHYRFTDPSPRAGLNQYRLLQVDMNGGAKRSDVVVAMFNSFGSMITPNPASEHATLSLEQAPPPNTFLRITDARGRLVKEQRLSVKGASIPMSFVGIESGLYSIGLYDEHGTPLGHTRFVKE